MDRASVARTALPVAALALVGCGFINDIDSSEGLSIRRFSLSRKEVAVGLSSTLSWEVEGADEVTIDNGVGVVKAKGSIDLTPTRTTTYTITARGSAGTSASASVQLVVGPATPLPSPSASPTPTPSPSASPSPSPSPSASPTPRPSPSGTAACGTSVTTAQGCAVTLERAVSLPAQECIEITRLTLSQGCPHSNGASRAVSFEVMAETELRDLRWRQLAGTRDRLDPSDGRLIRHGATTVITTQTVQEGSLASEIISEGQRVLVFRLRNN